MGRHRNQPLVRTGHRSRRSLFVIVGLVAVAAITLLELRGYGITSRRHAWPLEARVSRAARLFLMPAAVQSATNPVPASPDVIRDGMAHFADHCASCHANDGSGDISLGRAMFPPAPDMRAGATQVMTDGELFYTIERGIPFTGMAAWGNGTADGERSTWELVRFIRYLPRLSPDEERQMEALNPRSVAQEQQQKDIDNFLSGKN